VPVHCTHTDQVRRTSPHTNGCEECLRTGQHWVSLRLCQSCGHVGCCDSSPGKHARQHFQQTQHPIVRPLPNLEWAWCYLDNDYLIPDQLRELGAA
jgi:uncharacterized UBP type Zn finger protein